ncbi:transporter [Ganoderma sinense ZZ0214-1]|uniref:Transporter n=1 Tax=Ganoderma sinense ZZ0214-1 TaxID=1077348 RepID=A0A2G8S6W4_9APHY|nr:transporter [Ganoderma sinense ZZ0214-1]
MPQTPEAEAFLARIAKLPPAPAATDVLSQALQPSLDDEAELRKLWATDKTNVRLQDPHVGLVDIFDAPDDIRKTRARVVADDADLNAHHILPLAADRRRKEGEPAMVATLDAFKQNWAIFTEGSLSQLNDWSNVVAAGGAVQACLAPVPESALTSKRAMRRHFHNAAFPTSDVDLFLYGLAPEQAEAKMQAIYEAVRDSVPWDVTCVRTRHTVSIHSQFPYRSVQIVLRLYSSPAEILAGFDVDAPCCAWDGERVWASPRAVVAMMRQANTVDMTRRSPSYEVRLTKYSMRGFEVYVPGLRREDVDPTIFERSIQRVQGLARLLVLERLVDADTRQRYLIDRRKLRTRPDADVDYSRRKKKLKGDLKANIDIGGLEMNDYDVQSLHIPYGPGWDARRIDKLVYQTDLGMNSPYNPKNNDRRLHRHPAFFGTLKECIEDCCEYCPDPKDDEEKELQEKEDDSYVRGRIQFMQEDPGRQSISGSFNPIDDGEWSEQAYMGPTEKLFNAIVAGDRAAVAKIISAEGFDVDRRDHVGRTPLQIAILSKAVDIACDLVDAGARMTARVVDGRTALHLAAQLDLPVVVRKLLERSAVNKEKAEEEAEAKKQAAKEAEKKKQEDKMDVDDEDGDEKDENDDEDDEQDRDSSEDDWSSEDGDKSKAKDKAKPDISQIPEDEEDEPDVFDVNIPDWDYAFTALQYAVVFGSLGAIDELLAAGADATLVTKLDNYWAKPFHPLTLTALTMDVGVAGEVVKKLVAAGATSSQADDDLFTIFHKIVCANKPELAEAFLRNDPNAKAVIESPFMSGGALMTLPIVSAIVNHNPSMVAVLLAYGAKLTVTEEEFSRARELRKNTWHAPDLGWQGLIYWPLESAAARCNDLAELVLMLGADVNSGINAALRFGAQGRSKQTILDAVRGIVTQAKKDLEEINKSQSLNLAQTNGEKVKFQTLENMDGWKGALGKRLLKIMEEADAKGNTNTSVPLFLRSRSNDGEDHLKRSIEYFTQLEEDLLLRGAKTWKEVHPDEESLPGEFYRTGYYNYGGMNASAPGFTKMTGSWVAVAVPSHQTALYEELFEACCTGDNAKIEELCLPKKGKDGQELIQITARFGDAWGASPLSLALEHRHWVTARLVLAIAIAQYKPKDAKPPKFTITKIKLEDDDSDAGSDEDDDMDEEEEEINFIDVAQRPSEVQVDVPPERLLTATHRYQDPTTKGHVDVWPLQGAIIQDDFEAFVQIADLYKAMPKPLNMLVALVWAMQYDRPNMLDEVIRRTGAGIEVPEDSQDEDEAADGAKPKARSLKGYLGLNVHGKKRKDLAQKADPNAPVTPEKHEFPLAWTAAHDGALECVRYLESERALAAYRYYASTHSDERAKYLRRIDGQIAQRLGWRVDELNESIITSAVIGDEVELLKAVIDLRPAQLQDSLMARIHYVGFNHILIAANWGCSPDMFDYLLSKGVSPTDTDIRGWNVYHILATHNSTPHLKLLDHVLKKLPTDVSARMLIQQSKKALNTPLHIAVKKAGLKATQLLLKVKSTVFLLRAQDGSTPLHIATRNSLAEIVRLIGDAGPHEAFQMEDGVGNTPLEIAAFNWLHATTGRGFCGTLPTIQMFNENILHTYRHSDPQFVTPDEAKELKDTIDRLIASGRLRSGTKLATDLTTFVDKKDAEAKKRTESDSPKEDTSASEDPDAEYKDIVVGADAIKTMEYIAGAAGTQRSARQLIHLIDVHRSVQGSLDKSVYKQPSGNNDYNYRNKDEEGLEPEHVEDKEEKAKKHSAVSKWHSFNAFELFGEDYL